MTIINLNLYDFRFVDPRFKVSNNYIRCINDDSKDDEVVFSLIKERGKRDVVGNSAYSFSIRKKCSHNHH